LFFEHSLFKYHVKQTCTSPRELNSVGKDNVKYMQVPEFKPRPPQRKKKKHTQETHEHGFLLLVTRFIIIIYIYSVY